MCGLCRDKLVEIDCCTLEDLSFFLLARLMGQYCFARWHLSLSSSVTLPAGGSGTQVADTPWGLAGQ